MGRSTLALGLSCALSVSACAAAPPLPGPPMHAPQAARQPLARAPSVSAEVGALDEEKTDRAFQKARKKLTACYASGLERVPYLAGDVAFYVRVAGDGSTRYAYITESSLGDRETEDCMLRVLGSIGWPSPVGGDEGEARNQLRFDPGGDERPPSTGSERQLGDPFHRARGVLAQCKARAGSGPLKATMYVETDGKLAAVGVSASDAKGEAAVPCVVQALRGLKFPSPGSYASKVSVVID